MGPDASLPTSLSRLLELGFEREPEPVSTSEAVRVERAAYRVTAARPAMGTRVAITVLADSPDRADDAIGRTFREMDRLIGVFSRFEAASALSRLNEQGRLRGPPPELLHVVSRALHYHRATGGVFDISVAPLLELFRSRLGGPAPAAPSDVEVADALALVGASAVSASRRELRFGRAGMAVTVDGIAKGYIVDRMADVLAARRVRRYLVDAGGDIRAAGRKEGGRPWTIAVRDPAGGGVHRDTIRLDGGAVATSGGYERFFDPDQRFHHIVRPDVGRSPTQNASASALAPTAMAADALATTLFILAPADALALVDGLAGCECLIIDRNGRTLRSRGWRSAAPVGSGEGEGPWHPA